MPCLKHLGRSLKWFFLQLVILMGLNAVTFSQLLKHWIFTVCITLIHWLSTMHLDCDLLMQCQKKDKSFFFPAWICIIDSVAWSLSLTCKQSWIPSQLTEWFLSEFFFKFEMGFSVTLNRYFEIRPSLTRTQFDLIIDDKHLLDLFQCFVVDKDCRFFLLQTNKQTSEQTNK